MKFVASHSVAVVSAIFVHEQQKMYSTELKRYNKFNEFRVEKKNAQCLGGHSSALLIVTFPMIFLLYLSTVYWCYCCRRHCWHSRVCYCQTMHYKWTLCLYLSINFVCFSLILYNAIIVLFITINLCSVACALFSAEQVDGTGQSGRRTMAFITVAFIVQCLKSTR